MAKPYIDIAFITPLKEEFERLTATFPVIRDYVEGTFFWADVQIGHPDITAVVALQDDMGKAAATRAAKELISRYEIGMFAIVGIAGGLSSDVGIGDVCFTGPLFDILENSKVSDSSKGKVKIEFNTIPNKTDPRLCFALKYVSIGSDIKPAFEDWQLARYYKALELVPDEFIGRKSQNEVMGIPQIHDGSVVCGAVSKSDVYKSNIAGLDRKLLAIETETGGVFSEADPHRIPVVTIRGICDYADQNKNKLEEQTNGQTRHVAADNAVSFMKLQFSNPQLIKYLQGRKDAVAGWAENAKQKKEQSEVVPTALENLRLEVHRQLSQLTPEYQGKPIGYRLPIPRVRASTANATVSPATQKYDPLEALEAVASHRTCLIGIPKTYPDNGLPWVIASELSSIEINGKQAVPVVINGEGIRPPHGTLQSLTNVDLETLHKRDDARPVFIIYDFPASSKTRTEQLRTEQDHYGEAHFVLITKDKTGPTDSTALQVLIGAERFDLCEVSFVELALFFKRSFQLAEQQAGVLALRLQEMFRKFELNAHPSYFAGLSSDLLTALLKANRRSELLQLAVGGFLSFVVAGDEDSVVLSRTTREAFLRQLVFQIEVKGCEYDRPNLITFIEDFAKEKDFDIDSLLFLKAFQDKGIIHFFENKVRFSLPFMSSYLLASELRERPDEARKYFNLTSDEFDYPTFEIFCEIGNPKAITEKVIVELQNEVELYKDQLPNKHILLTNDIRPILVDHPARFKALEDQLQRAMDDVVNDRSNSQDKQRILDIAQRVEHSAREAHDEAQGDVEADEVRQQMQRLTRIWGVAIVALGSGSEQLDKDVKRLLSELIVKASSAILDRSLRAFPQAEFRQLKDELKKDSILREIFEIPDNEKVDQKKRDLLEAMVDAYEFSLLGMPLRAVFEHLGNFAGQGVLRSSVASVSTDDIMENLVAKIWSAEINAVQEKTALLAAIRDLPTVPFLRHSLSTYFMTRVFWNHWDVGNRLALLDAAEESLRPLHGSIDKGRIKRMVSGGNDEP